MAPRANDKPGELTMTDSSHSTNPRGFPPWRVFTQEDEAMPKSHSRRAILAGIAAAPTLPGPALALSEPDPIFAAIKRHRAAAEAHTAKVDDQEELDIADAPKDDP